MSRDMRIWYVSIYDSTLCEYCEGEGVEPSDTKKVCSVCFGSATGSQVVVINLVTIEMDKNRPHWKKPSERWMVVNPPTLDPLSWSTLNEHVITIDDHFMRLGLAVVADVVSCNQIEIREPLFSILKGPDEKKDNLDRDSHVCFFP